MVPESKIPNPEQLSFDHIKLRVGGKIVSGNIIEDLKIPDDPDSLASEISRHPSMYFYWSAAAEAAKLEYDRTKSQYGVWHAERYLECKRDLFEEFGKSYANDTMVKARMHERYGEDMDKYEKSLTDAEYRKNILYSVSKSFLEKGSSMINLLSWKKAHLNELGRG